MPPVPLSPALRPYDAVLLDLDGCLWIGPDATPRAPEAVQALREAGVALAFVTNDPVPAVETVVRKLWRLGFMASVHEVVTVGAAVQHLLATERDGGSAFVVGSQALVDHVADAGMRIANGTSFADRADVVVVGGHRDLHYAELRDATRSVLRGAELIGTGRDATFPTADGPAPGTGAVLAAIEAAAGRRADRIVGKPEPPMYAAALDRLAGAARVLAVGDRRDTDVAGAVAAGLDAALVGEGLGDGPEPALRAATLADLVLGAG
jgi:HAD superfamily hydrolase (TIGR01450 family)